MDFSIIEGLTDEEINELYENMKDVNNNFIAGCSCLVNNAYVHFGELNFGYCKLFDFSRWENCLDWCDRLRFGKPGNFLGPGGFHDVCWCPYTNTYTRYANCKR